MGFVLKLLDAADVLAIQDSRNTGRQAKSLLYKSLPPGITEAGTGGTTLNERERVKGVVSFCDDDCCAQAKVQFDNFPSLTLRVTGSPRPSLRSWRATQDKCRTSFVGQALGLSS